MKSYIPLIVLMTTSLVAMVPESNNFDVMDASDVMDAEVLPWPTTPGYQTEFQTALPQSISSLANNQPTNSYHNPASSTSHKLPHKKSGKAYVIRCLLYGQETKKQTLCNYLRIHHACSPLSGMTQLLKSHLEWMHDDPPTLDKSALVDFIILCDSLEEAETKKKKLENPLTLPKTLGGIFPKKGPAKYRGVCNGTGCNKSYYNNTSKTRIKQYLEKHKTICNCPVPDGKQPYTIE